MTKYYHELTFGERFDIYNRRLSWHRVAEVNPQPPWCKRENAVGGLFGCDELMIGGIKNELDCADCRFYKNSKA